MRIAPQSMHGAGPQPPSRSTAASFMMFGWFPRGATPDRRLGLQTLSFAVDNAAPPSIHHLECRVNSRVSGRLHRLEPARTASRTRKRHVCEASRMNAHAFRTGHRSVQDRKRRSAPGRALYPHIVPRRRGKKTTGPKAAGPRRPTDSRRPPMRRAVRPAPGRRRIARRGTAVRGRGTRMRRVRPP